MIWKYRTQTILFLLNFPNKRTALRNNLKAFSPHQQFNIIKELCELPHFEGNVGVKDLKIKLVPDMGHWMRGVKKEEINESLIEETQHWLSEYSDTLKLYNEGLEKYSNGFISKKFT